VTQGYRPPRLLEPSDRLDAFECRSDEQTQWPRHHGRQTHATGTARVMVVTQPGRDDAVAFYAWCMASIHVADAPARLRKGAGRYPQPIALLARLGVDLGHEGRGLGAGLLADVIARTVELGEEIGCRGLLIHAESSDAREFYLHLIPNLSGSRTDELHLVLLMKDIRRTLG
jgi:GNAT superfamily N-acetyltransferase